MTAEHWLIPFERLIVRHKASYGRMEQYKAAENRGAESRRGKARGRAIFEAADRTRRFRDSPSTIFTAA
jgi:hypothetical protein